MLIGGRGYHVILTSNGLEKIESYSIVKGTIYLLITTIGVVGNTVILLSFALIWLRERRLAKPETVLSHLAAANLIVFLTRMLPAVLYDYGWRNFFGDASCKAVCYIFRVFRGMAIGLTCLLSCFQCGVLSETRASTTEKDKIQRSVKPMICVLYLANMAVNADVAIMATNPFNASTFKFVFNPGFCLVIYPEKISFEATGYVDFAFDLIFVIPMALASGRILLILHKHKKKMDAVRILDQGSSAEIKATKTVIVLVSFYVSFYGIDNTIWLYQTVVNEINVVVSDVRVFFTMCYGAVFPFILTSFNKKINVLYKNYCTANCEVRM
ncbi:hypothetical protein NDU88_004691 [Pleurodeles waltl]|uniref:Vomeronasal type-1 receptor n=1 Tax=Pleurodeles waltl TaxID=8319 RepID=A0AAV7QIK2_PLEWA|nr:hypothetical protein NDU88_004691 [Pleurodeles waltl]